MNDKIPTYDECIELIMRSDMLENIFEHSVTVMKVALAITDNLLPEVTINRALVSAGAILHDITKTRALVTHEHHAATGGEFLREKGYESVAVIVEEHVDLKGFDIKGPLFEKEIVYYADKRVKHSEIVSLSHRIDDLVVRYGTTKDRREMILARKPLHEAIEKKIRSHLKRDLDEITSEIH